jgi:dTDP-4-dehydrorhamnose reductase
LTTGVVPVPRTLLIGAGGQLGSDIARVWPPERLTQFMHADADVTDRGRLSELIAAARPDLVINTAAFHNVDLCEAEPDRAFSVNATGAMHVADACREAGAALIFVSTDYVFGGSTGRAYTEQDVTDPINVYGVSKAAGEQLVRSRLAEHYIVRTSGLFGVAGSGGKGGNFVERMLQLAAEGRDLQVVNDQRLSPTYAADLAAKLLEIASTGRFGTYHVTNRGACSWYEFARTIFEMAGVDAKLSPTTTAAFAARARRPAYSVLENAALGREGVPLMRRWQEALEDYLRSTGRLVNREQIAGGT